MKAMLVAQNKSLFLRWELNSFFSQILREFFFKLSSRMAALSRGSKTEINSIWTKITYYLVKNKTMNSNHVVIC